MDELTMFFRVLGFLILAGVLMAAALIALAVVMVIFCAWVVLEGGRLFSGWVSARLRC